MAKFEIVSSYRDKEINLPKRKTKCSAGYDFEVAEDIVIPSYYKMMKDYAKKNLWDSSSAYTLEEMANFTKLNKMKPSLVPTGIKCYLAENEYLELSVRSSCPLKYWLILGNSVGIIDADYVDNPDNEGHIYFQIINLSPHDIQLKKGDAIGQGIIKNYLKVNDDFTSSERTGGFGSTDQVQSQIDQRYSSATGRQNIAYPSSYCQGNYANPTYDQISTAFHALGVSAEEATKAIKEGLKNIYYPIGGKA